MRKTTYSETVRPWLERFMDSNGAKVWGLLVSNSEDEITAGRLWLHIFVTAMSRIRPERMARYDDTWMNNLVAANLAEFAGSGVKIPAESPEWPDIAEEEDSIAKDGGCSSEHGEDEPEIHVPPILVMRTIQVLHATSAYFDAKRQHKGPQWTFAAALTTVVLACFAIGYGALAHFGYPASKLWVLIFGFSG
jgi:hypothetical protein